MKTKSEKISLRPYYTLGFPLLGLMAMVALLGAALTVVTHFI